MKVTGFGAYGELRPERDIPPGRHHASPVAVFKLCADALSLAKGRSRHGRRLTVMASQRNLRECDSDSDQRRQTTIGRQGELFRGHLGCKRRHIGFVISHQAQNLRSGVQAARSYRSNKGWVIVGLLVTPDQNGYFLIRWIARRLFKIKLLSCCPPASSILWLQRDGEPWLAAASQRLLSLPIGDSRIQAGGDLLQESQICSRLWLLNNNRMCYLNANSDP